MQEPVSSEKSEVSGEKSEVSGLVKPKSFEGYASPL